ncbi:hypothetical protein ACFLRB_02785 [Acidobacteriota bacterium]
MPELYQTIVLKLNQNPQNATLGGDPTNNVKLEVAVSLANGQQGNIRLAIVARGGAANPATRKKPTRIFTINGSTVIGDGNGDLTFIANTGSRDVQYQMLGLTEIPAPNNCTVTIKEWDA